MPPDPPSMGRLRGGHLGFLHKLGNPLPQILDPPLRYTAGCYIRDPTNTVSKKASSGLKDALLQSVVQKSDLEVGLRVTAKRLPKRAQGRNRDCPWMVQGDRRFYSERLLLRAVTSVATEQTMSFLAS